MTARRRLFYGWWIVLASFAITAYAGGAFWFGFGVFFGPLSREFGWTRAETAGAFSLASLEGGIEGPIVGPLVDRFGPRRLMFGGLIMVSLGFFVLSRIDSLLMFYFAYVALMAMGANASMGLAPTAAVANWFLRRRTIAVAVLSMGWSVGGGVMVPLVGWLVDVISWRTTCVLLGASVLLVGLPLSLVVRHRPEDHGLFPDGDAPLSSTAAESARSTEGALAQRSGLLSGAEFTLAEAIRTRAWWLLGLAMAMRNLSLSAVVAHQVTLLIDRGFDPQTAANLLGLVAIMGVPGRLIFGVLGDNLSKRHLMAGTMLLQGASLLVLCGAHSAEMVVLFAVMFGLAWGVAPLFMAIRADYFGRRNYATISGFQQAVAIMGQVVGPFFAGWVYDITTSYVIALVAFAAACVVAAVLALLATTPVKARSLAR